MAYFGETLTHSAFLGVGLGLLLHIEPIIGVGSIVTLKIGSSGKQASYTLLGAWDSIPEQNIIAYKTPLGQALLGKRMGDSVKVKIGTAEETYTVTSIARYADAR